MDEWIRYAKNNHTNIKEKEEESNEDLRLLRAMLFRKGLLIIYYGLQLIYNGKYIFHTR